MTAVMDRILSRIETTPDGCWEFQGSRLARGYGRISWNGRLWLTHRVTYLHQRGELPDNLEVDHVCKNPPCCNPAHLEAVTRSENIRRGTQWHHRAEQERAKTACPVGHLYSPENTYIAPDGHRQCRTCKKAAYKKYATKNRDRINARGREYRRRRAAS